MSAVSPSQIKELRQATGVGMMDCKNALEEAKGDYKRAVTILRERGLAKAIKKAGRAAAEGLVEFCVSPDARNAAVVELNCETDFAAKNESFRALAKKLPELALTMKAATPEALSQAKLPSGQTVDEEIKGLIASIGENIQLRRVSLFEGGANSFVCGYNHMGGKIGVLVSFERNANEAAFNETAFDIALHVAASGPRFLGPQDVSAADLEEEKRVIAKQLETQGKPANILEKIIDGQLKKFFADNCLLEQPFVKDPKISIRQLLAQAAPRATLTRFERFKLGDGVEVQESNFAEEVAKMSQ
jgi:elongation factor Ts